MTTCFWRTPNLSSCLLWQSPLMIVTNEMKSKISPWLSYFTDWHVTIVIVLTDANINFDQSEAEMPIDKRRTDTGFPCLVTPWTCMHDERLQFIQSFMYWFIYLMYACDLHYNPHTNDRFFFFFYYFALSVHTEWRKNRHIIEHLINAYRYDNLTLNVNQRLQWSMV